MIYYLDKCKKNDKKADLDFKHLFYFERLLTIVETNFDKLLN